MDNRYLFREVLGEIKDAADAAGGVITKEQVREQLSHLPLTEEHFDMIFKYLAEQGIRVPDDDAEAEELPEEQEELSLTIYLEELKRLIDEADIDENELLRDMIEGKPQAKDRLIEWYLPLICQMADEYEGSEIPVEDLIQEGNIGLLTAIESMGEFESLAACQAHLLNSVNQAMEDAIRENTDMKKSNDGIVSRVNHLNEAIKNLEEDLEHKVSVEELSAYLEMPAAEIEDVLRMSGDQIEVEKDS